MEQELVCEGIALSLLVEDSKSLVLLASTGDLTPLKATRLSLQETDQDGFTLLHHASKNGHLPVMQYLIDSGIHVDAADRKGNTALHLAVASGQTEAMDVLLSCGASHTVLNEEGDTPLHVAVRNGDLDLLEAFMAHHQVDLLPGLGNQTVFHILAEGDLIGLAQVVLKSKPFEDVVIKMINNTDYSLLRQTNKNRLTALQLAARKNSHQIMDLLLKACKSQGLSAEQVLSSCFNEDSSMLTPMQAAVDAGSSEVVKVLLHHGVSPLTVKGNEPPSIHLACFQGRLDIIESMVEHSGQGILNHRDDSGRTPLHYAVSARGCGVISYILSRTSLNIDAADTLGRTPLHAAVLLKNLSSAKQLIDGKADIFLKDNNHQNIFHFAVMKYREDMLRYLLLLPEVSGLMLEADQSGNTPFHLAIKCNLSVQILERSTVKDVQDVDGNYYIHLVSATGDKALLKKVLEAPSYLNALNEANKFGETPLHLAAQGGHSECVELLLDHGAFSHWSHMDRTAFFDACANGHVACARILLDRFPFQKDWTDGRGNTALHFAALSSCPTLMRFLLDSDIKISLNKDSQSFLEVAEERGCVNCVKAALNHSRWQECLDCGNSPNRSHVMLQFIRNMPAAVKLVLDHSFERATVEKSHPEYWEKFNFKYLQLQVSRHDTLNAARDIIEFGGADVINHPVVDTYIKQKWNKYGFWIYLFFFILRLILAILVSVFAVLVFNPGRLAPVGENATNVSQPAEVAFEVSLAAQLIRTMALVINLTLSVHLVFIIIAVGFLFLNVVVNASLWMFAFAMISNFAFLLTPNPLLVSPAAAALACFSSWLMVLIALGFFDIFGIYIRMFLRITRTVLQVLILTLILVLAFSLAFYVLIDTVPNFSLLQYSSITVFFYMLGEFQLDELISQDIEGQLRNGGLVFIFLFAIAILLSIVMANLLIALALGDIEKIKKNAFFEKKVTLIGYLRHFDSVPIIKRYNCNSLQSHVRYPNAEVSKIRQLWRYTWRAAKEDAISEEESNRDKISTEDGLVDQLDKLTTIVKNSTPHLLKIVNLWYGS